MFYLLDINIFKRTIDSKKELTKDYKK